LTIGPLKKVKNRDNLVILPARATRSRQSTDNPHPQRDFCPLSEKILLKIPL